MHRHCNRSVDHQDDSRWFQLPDSIEVVMKNKSLATLEFIFASYQTLF